VSLPFEPHVLDTTERLTKPANCKMSTSRDT